LLTVSSASNTYAFRDARNSTSSKAWSAGRPPAAEHWQTYDSDLLLTLQLTASLSIERYYLFGTRKSTSFSNVWLLEDITDHIIIFWAKHKAIHSQHLTQSS
jgi:hypothetical protein